MTRSGPCWTSGCEGVRINERGPEVCVDQLPHLRSSLSPSTPIITGTFVFFVLSLLLLFFLALHLLLLLRPLFIRTHLTWAA
jgi:hypothetical protein